MLFRPTGSLCRNCKYNSGHIKVTHHDSYLIMDFPAFQMMHCEKPPEILFQGLKRQPKFVFRVEADPNYYAIYAAEKDVRGVEPQLNRRKIDHDWQTETEPRGPLKS